MADRPRRGPEFFAHLVAVSASWFTKNGHPYAKPPQQARLGAPGDIPPPRSGGQPDSASPARSVASCQDIRLGTEEVR
jgi:hypothetical protein